MHVVALVAAVRRLSRQLLFADLLPAGMTRDGERSIWQLCRNGFRLDIYRSSKLKIKEETPKTQRNIQTNIRSHLENPSHIVSLVALAARLSPDGSGKLVRLQLLLGRSLAERVGGEGLAQVIRRLRPQQLLGPRCP